MLLVDVSLVVTGEEVGSDTGAASEVGFPLIVDAVEAEGLLRFWMTTGVCVESAGEVVVEKLDGPSGSVVDVGSGETVSFAKDAAEVVAEEDVMPVEVVGDS